MRRLIIVALGAFIIGTQAQPAIRASYETGYLGEALHALGLIDREAPASNGGR